MILAVVGSRDFIDEKFIFKKLDSLHKESKISAIISGGARGVDSIAKAWAIKNLGKENYIEKLPDWDTPAEGVPMKRNAYGKMFNPIAGHMRNSLIVNECTHLIAFWDGKSAGTKDSIDKAKKQNKLLEIVQVNKTQR